MKISLLGNKIAIKLQPGDDFATTIKKIKTHLAPYEYDPQTHLWLTTKMNLLVFEQIFQNEKIYYEPEVLGILEKQKKYLVKLDQFKNTEYDGKGFINIELFKHQRQAVNFMLNMPCSGDFDEQGLGKTLSIIFTLGILFDEKKIDKALVICPNTLKYNWEKEIKDFSELKCEVLTGSKEEMAEKISLGSQIYITNFESLIVKESKAGSKKKIKQSTIDKNKKFQDLFKGLIDEKTCIVIDEAHRIKSGSSKTSKFLRKMGKLAKYKYALTGTPIANKPEDIFYLAMFLDGGNLLGTNYFQFLKQYCILGNGFSEYAVVGYKNLDKLRFLVSLFSIRRLKKDVLDLPEKIFEDRIIETSNEHIGFYNKLKAGILQKIKEDGEVKNVKACLIRLIQGASNPILLDENCEIESGKVRELDALLEEHIEESGNKVIVWTNFVENFPYLVERYKKYNPVFINGSVSTEQRQANVLEFQNNENIKLIICNPQACREGLTLTASNIAIYLDRTNNMVDYLQSTDRIHRIGQTKTCFIINLICRSTIDEIVTNNIFRKHSLAQYVQGDTKSIEKQISDEELLELALK